MPEPINVADYERLASERLDPGVYGYFAGGAGDERTLRENVAAFGRWQLRPEVPIDVSGASAATSVLGSEVSMPLLVAPVAFQRLVDPDGEVAMAAAAAAGTIMCLSTIATSRPSELAAEAPATPRWLQLYCFSRRGVTRALIAEAVESASRRSRSPLTRRARAGASVTCGPDLRSWRASTPPRLRPRSALTARSASRRCSRSSTPRSTGTASPSSPPSAGCRSSSRESSAGRMRAALEHGAAGLIVSNHGGRQLDGVPATLDLLPEVVEAVDGRCEVLVDGGVRRGTDVVSALALGARAVLVGRAPSGALPREASRGRCGC